MNCKGLAFWFLSLLLATGMGCGGRKSTGEADRAVGAPDRIQGKAQVLIESATAIDSTLNAGGSSSVYIWQGVRRYRLYFRTPHDVTHGAEYVVEGVHAQRLIDEIGDPDQGKNGYPLQSSCRRVITMAWTNLALDAIDLSAQTLRSRLNRYPARPVFLVTDIQAVKSTEDTSATKKERSAPEPDVPEVSVPGAKQQTFLIAAAPVPNAPLWAPKADTENCKVIVGSDGRVAELITGKQLCEFVDWSLYRYQPPVQAGHPVRVNTEVQVHFLPLKVPTS